MDGGLFGNKLLLRHLEIGMANRLMLRETATNRAEFGDAFSLVPLLELQTMEHIINGANGVRIMRSPCSYECNRDG